MYPFKPTFKPFDVPQNMSQLNNSMPEESQWPNQAAYQHIDLEKVDWAALAQQWIHMKETSTQDDKMPDAPPPPNISIGEAPPPPSISHLPPPPKSISLNEMEEKGEAPMEVEREDEIVIPSFPVPSSTFSVARTWQQPSDHENQLDSKGHRSNSIIQNQIQEQMDPIKPWQKKPPGWNTWTNPKLMHQSRSSFRPPLLMDPYNRIQNEMEQDPKTVLRAVPTDLRTVFGSHTQHMWPPQNGPFPSGTVANNAYAGSPNQMDPQSKPGIDLNVDIMPTSLNAAQRKSLPAWIREGLEKMERTKQKEADRERELREREEAIQRRKLEDDNSNDGADNVTQAYHTKSKFESESDDSDSDGEKMAGNHTMTTSGIRSKSHSPPPPKLKPHRTKAEILQDIMLLVRPNLTEILLEVTNEEIEKMATDVYSKSRLKGFKAQTVRKNALTSLSGGLGLGLGIYADSDGSQSDSESENEGRNSRDSESDNDSDKELKETIDRRQRAFEKASADIEATLAKEEERERQWLGDDDEDERDGGTTDLTKRFNDESSSTSKHMPKSNVYSINKDSGEIQHEKNLFPAGRKFEKRQSRFSDTKVAYSIQASAIATNNLANITTKPATIESNKKLSPSRGNDSDSSTTSSRASKYTRQKSERNTKYDEDSNHDYHHHYKRSHKRSSRSGSESSYVSKNSSRSSRKHSRRSTSRSRRHRSRDRSKDRSRRTDYDNKSSRDHKSSRRDRDHKSSRKHRSRTRSRSRSRRF